MKNEKSILMSNLEMQSTMPDFIIFIICLKTATQDLQDAQSSIR